MLKSLVKLTKQLYDSPTFTTWGRFFVKLGGWASVLVLILHDASAEEVSVWMTFQTMIDFLVLFDIGLLQSFTRAFSYAFAGIKRFEVDKNGKLLSTDYGETNWELMNTIYGVSGRIYAFLAAGAAIVVAIYAFSILYPELHNLQLFSQYRILVLTSLVFLIVGGCSRLFGNLYVSILHGTNHIALVNRWEMLFGMLSTTSAILTYWFTKNIFWVVIIQNFWYILTVLRNSLLVHTKFSYLSIGAFDKSTFAIIWRTAWRTGMGILAGQGLIKATALMLVKFVSLQQAGAYQLAVKLIDTIAEFSRAPFYSRLPEMAIIYVRNEWKKLTNIAYKGMLISFLAFTSGTIAVAFLHEWILKILDSEATFVSNTIWFLIALAYGMERYGAMHLQLYTLSNHVLWHIANGVAGIIHICFLLATFPFLELTAFPLSVLMGNIFYTGYSASLVYQRLPVRVRDINRPLFCFIVLFWLLALLLFLLWKH